MLIKQQIEGKCKYQRQEANFTHFEKDHFDSNRSAKGIWEISDFVTCEKFAEEKDQYGGFGGFTFCDTKKCDKCAFFEKVKK